MVYDGVDRAHREFLRITDVTERTSDSKMCFADTEIIIELELPGLEESMSTVRNIASK